MFALCLTRHLTARVAHEFGRLPTQFFFFLSIMVFGARLSEHWAKSLAFSSIAPIPESPGSGVLGF